MFRLTTVLTQDFKSGFFVWDNGKSITYTGYGENRFDQKWDMRKNKSMIVVG